MTSARFLIPPKSPRFPLPMPVIETLPPEARSSAKLSSYRSRALHEERYGEISCLRSKGEGPHSAARAAAALLFTGWIRRSDEQCARRQDRPEPTGVREDYEPMPRVLL